MYTKPKLPSVVSIRTKFNTPHLNCRFTIFTSNSQKNWLFQIHHYKHHSDSLVEN